MMRRARRAGVRAAHRRRAATWAKPSARAWAARRSLATTQGRWRSRSRAGSSRGRCQSGSKASTLVSNSALRTGSSDSACSRAGGRTGRARAGTPTRLTSCAPRARRRVAKQVRVRRARSAGRRADPPAVAGPAAPAALRNPRRARASCTPADAARDAGPRRSRRRARTSAARGVRPANVARAPKRTAAGLVAITQIGQRSASSSVPPASSGCRRSVDIANMRAPKRPAARRTPAVLVQRAQSRSRTILPREISC